MTPTYRDAAELLWGPAGTAAHDAYTRLRAEHFPDLPEQLPIVIGLTAYGSCDGLTRHQWAQSLPRISLSSTLFRSGQLAVDDVLVHEMLHVHLGLSGVTSAHDGEPWYAAVRRLSPAVLGTELDARRGAGRRSVRIPNPDWTPGSDVPRTLVRKVAVAVEVGHADVARWPGAFRPDGYCSGPPIPCPTY